MTETATPLTYLQRRVLEATEEAAKLRTPAAAQRKLETLERQITAARERLSLARGRRPRSQQTRSRSEISAEQRISDLGIRRDAVKARIVQF